MKCNEVLQHLNEYIENDLDERLMEEINNHLKECSECKKVYEEEKELNDMFQEVLNSEPIEFNSRIGNIMNMIDKDKYSPLKEENEVTKSLENDEVIDFESAKNKNKKRFLFNKKIIAMAATFTIMIFMAPFIIGEQKKDMEFAVKDNKNTKSLGIENFYSEEADDLDAKEEGNVQYAASEEKTQDKMQKSNDAIVTETADNDSQLNEGVVEVTSYEEENANDENPEATSMAKNTASDKKGEVRVSFMADNKAEYLKDMHKIIFSNEDSNTTIKVNTEEQELGIVEGIVTSYVEEDEFVYIAYVGKDTKRESEISKIIKVNIETNKIETIYVSLKNEYVNKLELKEERINFFTIINGEQEKHKSMNK